MDFFLRLISEAPTIGFTILVGISLVYWLFVIVGAVGIDLLDGAGDATAGGIKGGAEGIAGALKGAGDAGAGAVKGLGEALGALKGAGDAASGGLKGAGEAIGGLKGVGDALGSLKGAGDVVSGVADAAAGGVKAAGDAAAGAVKGATDAAVDAADNLLVKPGGGLMALLGLVKVPVTVSGSLIVLWGWCASMLLMQHVAPHLGFLPAFVVKTLVGLIALVGATLAAAVTVRPLHGVFDTAEAPTRRASMGKVCTITSGRVDGGFGTAALDDGGAGLILNVFCGKENQLKKGDQALLLDYDAAKDAYEVEPVDWLLPEELRGIDDPTRAASIAASRARTR